MSNGQKNPSGTPFPIIPIAMGPGMPNIPVPYFSGTVDNPNAPQKSSSASIPSTDDQFPLLSKSKGFKEAMAESEQADEKGPEESTLPRSVIMQRNLTKLEDSEIYKRATGLERVKLQSAFYRKYVEPLGRRNAQPVKLEEWLKARGDQWLEKHPNPKFSHGDPYKFQMAASHEALKLAASPVDAYNAARQMFQNLKEQVGAASATFNATVLPHMGPVMLNPEHLEVKKLDPKVPGVGMTLDELYKTSKYVQENYYQDTVYDKLVLKGGGSIAGALPAIGLAEGGLAELGVSDLLGLEARTATKGIAGPITKSVFGKAAGFAKDVGKKSIYEGAQGYLLGSVEHEGQPIHEAINFAVGSAILGGSAKLLGKLGMWGGSKLLETSTGKAVSDYFSKTPDTQVTQAAVALGGSEKQKITRSIVQAINETTGGKFWTMPKEAQQAALKIIARKSPELAGEAGLIDKHITELQALQSLNLWRESMPEANEVLRKLEGLSKEPTSKTIANNVAAREQAQHMRRGSDKFIAEALKSPEVQNLINKDISSQVPGAASAKSLEFSGNFTKHVDQRLDRLGLGKDKFTWESRGHKLLFYLNVLSAETKAQGPSTFRDKESQLLMHQLHQEFPNKKLEDLLGMSDAIWTKIQNMEKAGQIKAGQPTRIWRQTHLGPGESPFAHEVDLLQKAHKAEQEGVVTKTVEQIKAEAKAKPEPVKMKLFVTKADEAALRKLGHSQAEINKMKPAEAQQALEAGSKKSSESFGTAASAYVTALRKMGYSPQDIAKMTPQDLAKIISQKIPKEVEAPAKAAAKGLTEDEKLAAAFKKSGDAGTGKIDTNILRTVTERLFPGQEYGKLTPSEQSEVNQVAAALSKARNKGK